MTIAETTLDEVGRRCRPLPNSGGAWISSTLEHVGESLDIFPSHPSSLRRLDSGPTPIRLRPTLLRTGFSRPIPLCLCAREDISQPRGDSALLGCPRGKRPASLAGNLNSLATMGDLPVQDAQARAAPRLAATDHPRSKENSRMITNHRNGNKVHRNTSPHPIP